MDETRLERAIRALSRLAATSAANNVLKTQVQSFQDQLALLKSWKKDCTRTITDKNGKVIKKVVSPEDARALLDLYQDLSVQITQLYIAIMCS